MPPTLQAGRKLSARQIIASTLLGTHPPVLEGRLLVAFAETFDVRPGTTRVALSRMVDARELENVDGRYSLTGDLLRRQRRQDWGLERVTADWDGTWETVVVRTGARSTPDRAALRNACIHLGLGELREGVWMRPANLDPARLPEDRYVVDNQADRFTSTAEDGLDIVTRVFDLTGWAQRSVELLGQMEACGAALDSKDPSAALPDGFVTSADVLRHLVADPALPEQLLPPDWPTRRLRSAYASYDLAYRSALRTFFKKVGS